MKTQLLFGGLLLLSSVGAFGDSKSSVEFFKVSRGFFQTDCLPDVNMDEILKSVESFRVAAGGLKWVNAALDEVRCFNLNTPTKPEGTKYSVRIICRKGSSVWPDGMCRTGEPPNPNGGF